jgi:hypothetical protein
VGRLIRHPLPVPADRYAIKLPFWTSVAWAANALDYAEDFAQHAPMYGFTLQAELRGNILELAEDIGHKALAWVGAWHAEVRP